MKKLIIYFLALAFVFLIGFCANPVIKTFGKAKQNIVQVGESIQNLVEPGPTTILPDPIVIVREIQQLARLETAAFTFQRVIQVERDQARLGGAFGEKLLFVVNGKVLAGVDLAKIQVENIKVVDNQTIQINLPKAEVFEVIVDNEKSYVFDRSKGFLAKTDPMLETQARKKSHETLKEAALNSELLDIAGKVAKYFISELIKNFGFQVRFVS